MGTTEFAPLVALATAEPFCARLAAAGFSSLTVQYGRGAAAPDLWEARAARGLARAADSATEQALVYRGCLWYTPPCSAA